MFLEPLLAILNQVCGPAGIAWTTPATELTKALTATGHFLNVRVLAQPLASENIPFSEAG